MRFRCGQVNATVKYNDRTSEYQVAMSAPDGKKTVRVKHPAALTRAVDSEASMRDAFHAALSFESHEGSDMSAHAWHDGERWAIKRVDR